MSKVLSREQVVEWRTLLFVGVELAELFDSHENLRKRVEQAEALLCVWRLWGIGWDSCPVCHSASTEMHEGWCPNGRTARALTTLEDDDE